MLNKTSCDRRNITSLIIETDMWRESFVIFKQVIGIVRPYTIL